MHVNYFLFSKTKFFYRLFYHNTIPVGFYWISTYICSISLCKIAQLQESEMRSTGWTLSYSRYDFSATRSWPPSYEGVSGSSISLISLTIFLRLWLCLWIIFFWLELWLWIIFLCFCDRLLLYRFLSCLSISSLWQQDSSLTSLQYLWLIVHVLVTNEGHLMSAAISVV